MNRRPAARVSYLLAIASALVIVVGVALFFARAFYRLNLLTIGDFYRKRYNKPVEVATSVCIVMEFSSMM